MALLIDQIKALCLEQGLDNTYWIGFSGGLDSHVLLHLCAELQKHYPIRLKAVHVHHGLSGHADEWALHCKKICDDLQIEFIQRSINAKATSGSSPEEIARNLRYAAFAELLAPNDILLTAHQQDDQAETLLVQLLRGSGPRGLSAMPTIKKFAAGLHARPLLSVSRQQLTQYAEQQQLKWINDESNEDKSFTRNFLRHSILPVLKQRWPTVTQTLSRTAKNCAEAEAFIEQVALQDLKTCYGENKFNLSIPKLLSFDPIRQRQMLRVWFTECGFIIPSSAKLHHIQQDFLHSQSDKLPVMQWEQAELRRYRDTLYLMKPLQPHDANQTFTWHLTQAIIIPNIGKLEARTENVMGLRTDIQQINIRFRQGGERCYFSSRRCHQLLKHLMQEWKIPAWQRDRVPLLFVDETLVAVIGFFLDERYQSTPGQNLFLSCF